MMTTSYDPDADALSVFFGPANVKVDATAEVAPGVMLDYDAEGHVVGIEILYVKKRGGDQPKAP